MNKPARATHHIRIKGTQLEVADFEDSLTIPIVRRELEKDVYGIENIRFSDNDVVIDIGAHVGLFAIYLAKRQPGITIHAFEPIPDSYESLLENIARNNTPNIIPHNLAVTGDGRDFRMLVNFLDNSGGATGHLDNMSLNGHWHYVVQSTTLEDIFIQNRIDCCRLLKIDCEGAEYEILLNSSRYLKRVDYLSGEFHINNHLIAQGYSVKNLQAFCGEHVSPSHLSIKAVRMAE